MYKILGNKSVIMLYVFVIKECFKRILDDIYLSWKDEFKRIIK